MRNVSKYLCTEVMGWGRYAKGIKKESYMSFWNLLVEEIKWGHADRLRSSMIWRMGDGKQN